jgi:hypothetical protein
MPRESAAQRQIPVRAAASPHTGRKRLWHVETDVSALGAAYRHLLSQAP